MIVTSDEGTSYCPCCEELARERDRYREALELIAAGMESAKSIAEVTLRPVAPEEGEDG